MNRSRLNIRPKNRLLDSFRDPLDLKSRTKRAKEKYKHINFWLSQDDDIYDVIIPVCSTSKKN